MIIIRSRYVVLTFGKEDWFLNAITELFDGAFGIVCPGKHDFGRNSRTRHEDKQTEVTTVAFPFNLCPSTTLGYYPFKPTPTQSFDLNSSYHTILSNFTSLFLAK